MPAMPPRNGLFCSPTCRHGRHLDAEREAALLLLGNAHAGLGGDKGSMSSSSRRAGAGSAAIGRMSRVAPSTIGQRHPATRSAKRRNLIEQALAAETVGGFAASPAAVNS